MNNMHGPLDREILASIRDLDEEGSNAVFQELVGLFLAEAPGRLARIKKAVQECDGEAARQAAHSLKGSSGSFGAAGLAQMCNEIEQMGATGHVELPPEALAELEHEYQRVEAALGRELARA